MILFLPVLFFVFCLIDLVTGYLRVRLKEQENCVRAFNYFRLDGKVERPWLTVG